MSNLTRNKTSAKLLLEFASRKWGPEAKDALPELERRYLIVSDLYIKARSYAIINKTAFWLAIIAGVMILVWPSLAIIMKDFGWEMEFLKSAIVQTTVTGLAVLTFAVYSHYKKRQVYVENLMRHVIYSDESVEGLIERVLKEVERIDAGFSFSEAIMKKPKDEDEEQGG